MTMPYWFGWAALLVVVGGLVLATGQPTGIALIAVPPFVGAAWWVREERRRAADPTTAPVAVAQDGPIVATSPDQAAKLLRFARWIVVLTVATGVAMVVVFSVLLIVLGEVALTVTLVLTMGAAVVLTWWRARVPYLNLKRAASGVETSGG